MNLDLPGDRSSAQPTALEQSLLDLRAYIGEHTGIQFRPADDVKFSLLVSARIAQLRLDNIPAYRALLADDESHSSTEWKFLLANLVPGESYFFRDTAQMELLQREILPELIAARRAAGDFQLRIWSAGCSTGEEAYSLAALVYDLLPDSDEWRRLVLGTDPNEPALQKARAARYTAWSFRQVAPERRERFFREVAGTFEVQPFVRKLVEFATHDLVRDAFPDGDRLRDIDLLLCRNVFIYLKSEVTAAIVRRMERTLRNGGYLVTGHGELTDRRPAGLRTRVFPASIVYHKSTEDDDHKPPPAPRQAERSAAPPPQPRAFTAPLASRPPAARLPILVDPPPESPSAGAAVPTMPEQEASDPLAHARELLREGHAAAAIESGDSGGGLEDFHRRNPADLDAACLLARAYANLGEHEAAGLVLGTILERHPFSVRGYFLMAQIAEEQGDLVRAMDLLKRAIYVDAAYLPAYLELGLLYRRAEDPLRARRMLASAAELLKRLSPETEIEEYDGQHAAALSELVVGHLETL